ncbi:MAG: hypothetical protein AAF074_03450 [Pseudomonadota bacterium]
MPVMDIAYFFVAFAALIAVAGVLVVIGGAAARCPQTATVARLGTWVVTTGFVAIGSGVIALIGASLPFLIEGRMAGLYAALGMAFIALGIGFWVAASTLRDILNAATGPATAPEAPEALAA